MMICDECQALYEEVGDRVRKADVFVKVRRNDEGLVCDARLPDVGAHAYYQVHVASDHEVVWVGLYTPDRWLSESIETDLLAKQDSAADVLEDELYDQGFEARLPVEHERNEQKQFVFRSPVFLPKGQSLDGQLMITQVTQVLLAYEAAFSQLGDMVCEDSIR